MPHVATQPSVLLTLIMVQVGNRGQLLQPWLLRISCAFEHLITQGYRRERYDSAVLCNRNATALKPPPSFTLRQRAIIPRRWTQSRHDYSRQRTHSTGVSISLRARVQARCRGDLSEIVGDNPTLPPTPRNLRKTRSNFEPPLDVREQ